MYYICTICLYASRDGWMWCPARHRGTCMYVCVRRPIARWDRCERSIEATESSIDRSFVRVHRTVDERARRARTSPRTRSVASSIHPFIQSRIDGFFRHPLSTPGSFSRDIYDASRTPRCLASMTFIDENRSFSSMPSIDVHRSFSSMPSIDENR